MRRSRACSARTASAQPARPSACPPPVPRRSAITCEDSHVDPNNMSNNGRLAHLAHFPLCWATILSTVGLQVGTHPRGSLLDKSIKKRLPVVTHGPSRARLQFELNGKSGHANKVEVLLQSETGSTTCARALHTSNPESKSRSRGNVILEIPKQLLPLDTQSLSSLPKTPSLLGFLNSLQCTYSKLNLA